MASLEIIVPQQPTPGRRRGRATAMVVAELGLDEAALADVLCWARSRVEPLLRSLDDAELRALLAPAGDERRAAADRERPTDGGAEAEGPAGAEGGAEAERRAADERSAEHERRAAPRYSLVEPAVIEVASWSELVALYTKDISCGGMFVQTDAPPERDTRVAVQMLLPDGAGTLTFEGVVVHVVEPAQARDTGQAAGFGLQFSGLTAERRRALQRLVEQAEAAASRSRPDGPNLQELGFTRTPGEPGGLRLSLSEAEHQQMRALRAELAAITARGDLEVLGLRAAADLDELRDAFERLARRWHPSVAHRDAPPEIRRLATEIFLRIEQAYRRLREAPRATGLVPPPPPFASTPRPKAKAVPGPKSKAEPERRPGEPARSRREAAPTAASPPPPRGDATNSEPDPVRARQRARLTKRVLGRLAERSEQLAAQLKRRDASAAAPRHGQRALVDEALRLLTDKRYAEAAERLEQALRRTPDQRLHVLLCVVQARKALTERDFSQARERYEAVLRLDPDNEVAQRELLMLSALQR